MDTECCGTATSVIKMARTEPEHELTISKEERIPVDTDFEMEVIDISQEDEINPLKEKNVVIENHPIDFKKVYLHNTENVNWDKKSVVEINVEKNISNIEGEFFKSQNEEEASMNISVFRDAELQIDSKTVQNVQFFNIVKADTLIEIKKTETIQMKRG